MSTASWKKLFFFSSANIALTSGLLGVYNLLRVGNLCCIIVAMTNPKKKKKMNATASRRGRQLPTRVDEPMWATLERIAKRDRRSVSQTVILLLEEALIARGEAAAPPPSPDA